MKTSRILLITSLIICGIGIGSWKANSAISDVRPGSWTDIGAKVLPPGEIIWGSPCHGVVMSVVPAHKEYLLGQPIPIYLAIKNSGKNEVWMDFATMIKRDDWVDYAINRILLYNKKGVLAPKSSAYLEFEAINDPDKLLLTGGSFWGGGIGSFEVNALDASRWFTLTEPGVYRLLVMRRFTTWEAPGYLVSNIAEITVKAAKR